MGYHIRMRTLSILLVAALATFAPVGGVGSTGIAHANLSPNGLIQLDYVELYGDEIRIDWIITEPDSYQQSVNLYRLPDETEITIEYSELTILYNSGYLRKSLGSGAYRLVITLLAGDDVADTYIYDFAMPDPVTRLVHVFGSDGPIDDLVFRQTFPWSEEPLTAAEIPNPGKGYVTYAVEILPSGCFTMESNTYHFSIGGEVCADSAEAFIVQASDDTDNLVQLDAFYAYEDEEKGVLAGYLLLRMEIWGELKMDLYDREGTPHACEMYGEARYEFECELPDDPAYLQVDKFIQGVPAPTNVVIPMDDINLPENITVVDRDPRVNRIDPLIEFEDVPNDTEFAFYKIMPTQDSYWSSGIRYIPVGEGPYSFALENIEADLYDYRYVAIQLVDTAGNLYAKTAEFPIIDKMTEQDARIQYEDNGMEALHESYLPDNPSFRDIDWTEGGRAGTVTWTLPDTGEYALTAYDLYYTDSNQDPIRGEARVYVNHRLADTFEYMLEDVPEGAAYLEVVPLLREENQWTYQDYYGDSFFIPLNDRVTPLLDELAVDGNPVYPKPRQDGSSYYEYTAAWNADVAVVTASSMNGVVYVGDEGPAASVTATVYLNEPVKAVSIRVGTPEGDWSSEYDLVIAKEPAPDAPKLASLIVDGREIEPAGSLYSISVDHDASAVAVTASAGADVEIELAGIRQFGSVEAFIPITDDEMSLPIRLYDPATGREAEYVLSIVREVPDNLVLGVLAGWFDAGDDGYVYSGVPRGMTAGRLKERFVTVSGTVMMVRDREGVAVSDDHIVQPGYTIELIRGPKTQTIRLEMLSERLKSILGLPTDSPLAFVHIATLWIHYPEDLNGDGKIDSKDARLLLDEMD